MGGENLCYSYRDWATSSAISASYGPTELFPVGPSTQVCADTQRLALGCRAYNKLPISAY